VERGDDRKGDDKGDGVGGVIAPVGGDECQPLEARFEQMCDGRFPDPTQTDTGDGNAQLGRGDVGIEVVEQIEDTAGAAISFGGEVLDAGTPHGDESELGGDKEPIREDEDHDSDERQRGTNRKLLTGTGVT